VIPGTEIKQKIDKCLKVAQIKDYSPFKAALIFFDISPKN
jgi:hypothetical protein